jgi:hypothetical protein
LGGGGSVKSGALALRNAQAQTPTRVRSAHTPSPFCAARKKGRVAPELPPPLGAQREGEGEGGWRLRKLQAWLPRLEAWAT